MIYIVLNAFPIFVAGLVGTGIALLWYRRALPVVTLVTLLVAQAWLAAILAGALILAPPKGSVWTMTLGSAFIIWLGFILPAIVASYRLRGLAWRTIAVDVGYWLVSMLAQAAVMRAIGVVAPPI